YGRVIEDISSTDSQAAHNLALSIDERLQALVYRELNNAVAFNIAAVVTLGDPALYSRFGFELAAHYDLHCRWPGTESAFQVHRLA
ncbi:GNAT family N-acetyltransferase, partial [Salmonella enterica subsp. enterica serovar Kentucky]|nr:GNAT family N-acetyltransferase [Salmonella enterica subsp. enterica serovar Kentucky]